MAERPRKKDPGLRQRAESRLREAGEHSIAGRPIADVEHLIHELRVHQAELEIQNDELLAARVELEAAHDRYRELYEFAPVGYLTIDGDGLIAEANLAFIRMLDLYRSDVLGQTFHRLVARADEAAYFAHRREVMEFAREGHCELRLVREDGSWCDVLLQSAPVLGDGGGVTAQRSVVTDMTARKAAEAAWREADLIIEAAAEAIVVLGRDRRVTRVNPAFTALCGLDPPGVMDRDFAELLEDGPDSALVKELWRTLSDTGGWRGDVVMRRHEGDAFTADLSLVEVYDERGNRSGYAALFADISDRKRVEQQLRERALHDALTGLRNHGSFRECLQAELSEARRHRRMIALLLIDLDGLKSVNDRLGHAAGDALLRAVARRLTSSVRGHDVVARVGGDEFAVILTDIEHANHVAVIAAKILERCAAPVTYDGHECPSGVSIGIALGPIDAEAPDELARSADLALYRAKGDGGGQYCFFRPSMTRHAREHARVERDLDRALRESEFRLAYQPIVEAGSGRVAGAEALLRWASPGRGLLLPEPFLGVAEDTGQITAIGAWVIDNAAARWRQWCCERAGGDIPFLSFNVSPRQLTYTHAFEQTLEQLRRCGLPPGRTCVEVTEGLAMNADGNGREHLHALKALGLSLAMDDFGTGYSALGSLKDLPFDLIKIDRSFIHDLETSDDAAHIVRAIIHMTRELGRRVVAEGVETAEQLDFVTSVGVDYVQGHYLCRPLDEAAMERVLAEGLPAAPTDG